LKEKVKVALVQAVLAGRLTSIFSQPGDNAAVKASEWASAYQTYALPAMAGVLLPAFLGIEQDAFLATIAPIFNNPNGTVAQFANALANAVEAFWLLPPVLFAGPAVAGAVTSFPGKGALVAQLTGILSNQYQDAGTPARQIATALDTATRTVIVTFAPPPGSTTTLV
jgi:hypothetical protein